MKRYRVEFSTTEYLYVDGYGLADVYWVANTYEHANRLITEIEEIK